MNSHHHEKLQKLHDLVHTFPKGINGYACWKALRCTLTFQGILCEYYEVGVSGPPDDDLASKIRTGISCY
jgi:hypothetical protein